MIYPTTTQSTERDYADGYHYGIEWAQQDALEGGGMSSHWLKTFQEEAQASSRWARAFYLGALRGYREVCRSQLNGRWGT